MTKGKIEKAIRTIQKRLDDKTDDRTVLQLRGSEIRTRYALIDPLLRACGWNTEDPNEVDLESWRPAGAEPMRPIDYKINIGDGACLFVEAKRLALGQQALENRSGQLSKYVRGQSGAAVLTNGDIWIIYWLDVPGRFREKRRAEFSVSGDTLNDSVGLAYKWLDKASWQ